MIFRLRFKYKFMCTVIVFIVIFLLIICFKSTYLKKCSLHEPIDVVYTWVNGTDPLFIKELVNYTRRLSSGQVDKSKVRYFDRYELKFSLRSLEKFAPWIRNVYIVTNGQIPYWLNLDHEKVYLISHEDIFVDQNDLPTFSSPSIEMHLHRIPGISKKFLYFNDDIYLGAPIYFEDFYSESHGYLIYLDYALPGCASGCSWIYVHDGQCDKECNVVNCQMDGGDCDNNASYSTRTFHKQSSPNVTYLHTSISEIESTTHSSQNVTTAVQNYANSSAFSKLVLNLEESSVKKLVATHNRNKIIEDKRLRRTIVRKKRKSPPFDAYQASLQHTNRMFNKKYGFTQRFVLAHMPFLIDVDIMTELQETFPEEFKITSSNRIRRNNDVQFAFSYFNFLMSEKVAVVIEEIFDMFDTDLSGTWSDREIRTVLTKLYTTPLQPGDIDRFESLLINCSKIVQPKPVTTPEYERYIDSALPTISKELVMECKDLREYLWKMFGRIFKYNFEIIRDVKKYVTFEMIVSNIQSTVAILDRIRKRPTKFVCLNDDVYISNTTTISAIWYDFYISLFPLPSTFELPGEYRNRFQYIKDLRWYQTKMTIYLYGCVLLFTYFLIYLLCKIKILYFLKNKLYF